MKKYLCLMLILMVTVVVLMISNLQSVSAGVPELPSPTISIPTPVPPAFRPAAGSWTWDNVDVTGMIVPQYQLVKASTNDYALLQSEGLNINGPARICHPYPGGQFGWNAEIRVLTSNGWQSVLTVNQWVPDKEGQYMTCAQVWYKGVYAVFGYWEKPEGWGIVDHFCADVPSEFEIYVGPVATFANPLGAMVNGELLIGQRCSQPTDFIYTPGAVYWESEDGLDKMVFEFATYYCACESIYMLNDFQ